MDKEYTITPTEQECLEKTKEGVDYLANIIKLTLGPAGCNALLERRGIGGGGRGPAITNDGVSIAKTIIHKDEVVDQAVQAMIDGCNKTNDMVGDGTTSTAVLAQSIFNTCYERLKKESDLIEKSVNANDLKRQIKEDCVKVVEALKKTARKLKKEDIKKIAYSSYNDNEMADKIAELADKVGEKGHISVEENFGYETKISVVQGMQISAKYKTELTNYLRVNARKEAIVKEPYIMITNQPINDIWWLKSFAEYLVKAKDVRELVIIAPEFERNVYNLIANNNISGSFYYLPIKAGGQTTDEFEDIAVYTNAHFFDTKKGFDLKTLPKVEELGRAKKVLSTREDTLIISGAGKKESIDSRIKYLEVERDESEKTDELKKKIDLRIASLAGGVGLIEVSANTDAEKEYVYRKVEDAVSAVKAGREEGVVKGGGLALKELADQFKDSILYDALKSPNERIVTNGCREIKEDILDPLKVVRVSLENACSLASSLITGGIINAWARDGLKEKVGEAARQAMGDTDAYSKRQAYTR